MSNGCVGPNSDVETRISGNDRWRELFPIPLCSNSVHGDTGSSSSRRRRVKVQRLHEESMQVIECLNEMYSSSTNFSHDGGSTTAQRASQHAIFSQLARQKQPVKPCKEREAVEELLRTSLSYSGDEAQTSVVSYERDLVSLPQCAAEPVALDQVLDNHGRELIKDTSRCMLLSMEEWGQVCEQNQPIKTYMDVKLQSDLGAYAMFVHDLFLKGMIEFNSNPKDVVAPFFVKKNDGRQRMVLDCRAVNRRFRQPPPVALAAGYSWTRLEFPEHSKLYMWPRVISRITSIHFLFQKISEACFDMKAGRFLEALAGFSINGWGASWTRRLDLAFSSCSAYGMELGNVSCTTCSPGADSCGNWYFTFPNFGRQCPCS